MNNCICLDCKKNTKSPSDSLKLRAENRRRKLIEIIEKNPGIQFRDLMRLANLKNGVLSHHLRRLEKIGSLKVERATRQTRFYPIDFSNEEAKIAKALRRKTPRDIIYTLMENGGENKKGLKFNQIVSDVSKSPSTVSLYLSQLIQDNIVTITRDSNRKRKYHLSNKQLVDKQIEEHQPGMFDKSVSGFEDIINSL